MDNVGELARRVTFSVYQDTRSANIWDLLGGGKDDVLTYDRCGLLTYHIPYPRSLLNERHFQNALWDTYFRNPCGCNSTYNPEPVQRNIASSQQSNSQTTQLVRQQPGGQRQRPGDRRHPHQHHHQHQRNRRVKRTQRSSGRSEAILHRNRMAEILSNRISKCRFDDTLCHILYSNAIRYKRKHANLVSKLLSQHCRQCPNTQIQCLCPRYVATENCTCSNGTVTFSKDEDLDVSFCSCSQAFLPNEEYDINPCVCKTCEVATTAPRHITATDRMT